MRSRYKVIDNNQIYFITSTIIEWIPVFINDNYFNILVDSVKHCQLKKNLKVYSYIFLDNHFHMIVSHENLSDTIASLKSYTAKKIIELLKLENKENLLDNLQLHKLSYKIESTYQVWQEGFHPQLISTDEIFQQKIDYIHFNPVRRGLVDDPCKWKYSSASYYYLGEEGVIKIDELG